MDFGYEKGEKCNRDGCKGIIEEYESENQCCCHINPPCSYCTDSREYCPICGWDGRTEQIEDNKKRNSTFQKTYDVFKSRTMEDLDRTKIDYISESHTHFSMIKKGVFPKGTTRSEVAEIVKGTFGGRFAYFNEKSCEFEYVAYTD